MQHQLLIAILSGLGAMLGWGFADFFAKKTIDKIGDLPTLFWSQLIGVIPLFIAFLIDPVITIHSSMDPFYFMLFGIVSGLSYLPLYTAFGKGQVSIISPIFASYGGVVVLLSAFLFGETIPFLRAVALAIIFIGIILTCINFGTLRTSLFKMRTIKGLPEVLTALIVFSFWLVLYGNFVNNKDWLFSILFVRVVSTITLFFYAFLNKVSLKIISKDLFMPLVLVGGCDVLAFALLSLGFSATQYTSIVAMLSGAFSLPTIVLAHFFLKERLTLLQIAGIFTIIAGIIVLSM